ncbi:hypothetical protein [Zavarzinella formosa]|uniref:hypothetical protein n=1 Tax=Zavarzinella formosa TaxID=360055 RepID=UPI0002EE2450|nr:hypothetical protein [Zavarzinella formosa]
MTDQYFYCLDNDGCDQFFDIQNPNGRTIASVQFWDDREQAEADAKFIVHRLAMHDKLLAACTRHLRQMELMLEMDDPQAFTQIEWEAEPLASLRQVIAEAEEQVIQPTD